MQIARSVFIGSQSQKSETFCVLWHVCVVPGRLFAVNNVRVNGWQVIFCKSNTPPSERSDAYAESEELTWNSRSFPCISGFVFGIYWHQEIDECVLVKFVKGGYHGQID
jgi:hypothetical protein